MLAALLILGQHFLFDWILQPRWVAVNKSKNSIALALHGVIITVGFFGAMVVLKPLLIATLLSIIYGLLHVIQDRVVWSTFKAKTDNPYLEKGFWNLIAVDQFIHLSIAFGLVYETFTKGMV